MGRIRPSGKEVEIRRGVRGGEGGRAAIRGFVQLLKVLLSVIRSGEGG